MNLTNELKSLHPAPVTKKPSSTTVDTLYNIIAVIAVIMIVIGVGLIWWRWPVLLSLLPMNSRASNNSNENASIPPLSNVNTVVANTLRAQKNIQSIVAPKDDKKQRELADDKKQLNNNKIVHERKDDQKDVKEAKQESPSKGDNKPEVKTAKQETKEEKEGQKADPSQQLSLDEAVAGLLSRKKSLSAQDTKALKSFDQKQLSSEVVKQCLEKNRLSSAHQILSTLNVNLEEQAVKILETKSDMTMDEINEAFGDFTLEELSEVISTVKDIPNAKLLSDHLESRVFEIMKEQVINEEEISVDDAMDMGAFAVRYGIAAETTCARFGQLFLKHLEVDADFAVALYYYATSAAGASVHDILKGLLAAAPKKHSQAYLACLMSIIDNPKNGDALEGSQEDSYEVQEYEGPGYDDY